MALEKIRTPTLKIAYYEYGPATGWPVLLLHGFPYSPTAYEDVGPALADKGARVIVPYLRGFGPTRFLSQETMRTGQQAALGSDVIDLLDALGIDKAIVAGFDWGGVAACTASALWPERVVGLVSYAGYDIVDRAAQAEPADPELECVMWYQHLFQHERGRACLERSRKELCRLLWKQWSPTCAWDEALFQRTAEAFDNPDWVDIVIQAYRFCFGEGVGDPSLQHLEERLALKPAISVPAITLDGTRDPLKPGGSASHDAMFVGGHERRVFDVGHAFPIEAPRAFTDAILSIAGLQD
jgi:pimeloyl-ACP methyl ester carboxylesterase